MPVAAASPSEEAKRALAIIPELSDGIVDKLFQLWWWIRGRDFLKILPKFSGKSFLCGDNA
jgi:hypothetical protein